MWQTGAWATCKELLIKGLTDSERSELDPMEGPVQI